MRIVTHFAALSGFPMNRKNKITVLMDPAEFRRFDSFCETRGLKKSTFLVHLIREHLDQENYRPQDGLFESTPVTSRDQETRQ